MDSHPSLFEQLYERLEKGLPAGLTYHDPSHTRYVVEKASFLADREGLQPREQELVRLAALFHDTGYLWDRHQHEEKGCAFAKSTLQDLNYSQEELEHICRMIMATRIPQQAVDRYEKIMADADLFYLGTAEYAELSQRLFQEILYYEPHLTAKQWLSRQKRFLKEHTYFTVYGKEVLEPVKRRNLADLG